MFYLNVPPELCVQIFLNLPYEDVIRCRRVCRFFRELSTTPSFWRAKCHYDFPTPKFPPLISSRPHDVYLELVSRDDVTMGSEKFKTWEKCLGRAMAKGHLKLVQYFWSFNRIYLQAHKPFIARPYWRPFCWVLEAVRSGHLNIVKFLMSRMTPYEENEIVQLVAAAMTHRHTVVLDFLEDPASWKPSVDMPMSLEKLVDDMYYSGNIIISEQPYEDLIDHGKVIGLVEANDPTRFEEVPRKIWRRYAKKILDNVNHYQLYKRGHSLGYLNSFVSPKRQWHRPQWQAVEAGDLEMIAQVERQAVEGESEWIFVSLARHGQCEMIQQRLPNMSGDTIAMAFGEACKAKQRDVVELLLPRLDGAKSGTIQSLLTAGYIDLAYQLVNTQTFSTEGQGMICYDAIISQHKDFAGYVLHRYQPDKSWLIEQHGLDPCIGLERPTPDGRYPIVMTTNAFYHSGMDDLIEFYYAHTEIPWDVSFLLEPETYWTYDELIGCLRTRCNDFKTTRRVRQLIDQVEQDRNRPAKRHKV
jgi:hypothetical protein